MPSCPAHLYCKPLEQPHLQRPNASKFAKEEELSELAEGLVPENTNKSTKWDLNNFEALMKARNTSYPDDQVPQDILLCSDPELLNLHLSRFVIETNCFILYVY